MDEEKVKDNELQDVEANTSDEQENNGEVTYRFFERDDENKKIVKKKIKIPFYVYVIGGVVISILVLIIALAVVAGSDEEGSVDNNQLQEVIPDSGEFNDKLAKSIYEKKLPFVGHYVNGKNMYDVSSVSYDSLDKGQLRAYAYLNIEFKAEDVKLYAEDGTVSDCVEGNCKYKDLLNTGLFAFDAKLLQDSAVKLYGKEIENGDFYEHLTTGATYKDGYYYHTANSEGNFLSYHHREYVSYELVEDTLYVYDKYLYIYGELDSRSDNYNIEVFADSAKKKSLGKGTYLEADNLVDFIVPNYDRKKSNYKHTFKKSSEGNWYWVSSEPIQPSK